jgi:hypothetical protein
MVGNHSQRGCSYCHHPVQRLDDAPGRDVPRAIVHDVELLAVLIDAGVGVVVDSLQCPLGVLEVHLLLLVALGSNLLLALSQLRRSAVMVRLLDLPLIELLYECLDLSALLRAVAPRVVYRAPRTTLIAAGGLLRPLVAMWATTPTSHYSSSSNSGSTSQQLVVATNLLLLLFVFVAALSSGICIKLAGFPYLWGWL